MKAVLISIQPQWVEKIASGEKTIEVRKSRPKIETPFKCYIYCTKIKNGFLKIRKGVEELGNPVYRIDGKVIGEFVCDRIEDYTYGYYGYADSVSEESLAQTCLTANAFCDYGKQKTLYGWHISNLKIYDKPKELSEFMKAGKDYYCDISCKHLTTKEKPLSSCDRYCDKYETYLYYNDSFLRCNECLCENCIITRPPQSWCLLKKSIKTILVVNLIKATKKVARKPSERYGKTLRTTMLERMNGERSFDLSME